MLEYMWLRDYIRLDNEINIKNKLNNRTNIFNRLGMQGWKVIELDGAHFLFVREKDSINTKYEYAWVRFYIPCETDEQMCKDLEKLTEVFNYYSFNGYEYCGETQGMYCFVKMVNN